MPSQQFIVHPADLPYVPTIMRAPSPSSTIGTDYGPDETDLADSELSEREFVRKCEGMAGINRPRPEEDEANRDPLLHPRPLRQKLTPQEESFMFQHVMDNLRAAVKKLEEEELFEQTAVKDAGVALDDPTPSSDDLGEIMRSLMDLNSTALPRHSTATTTILNSTRFTDRSETVTPQFGGATAAALASIRNASAGSSTTPTMRWPPRQ
ncbi:uncharacterized protein TRAVEDRAFT_166382 [Trametes versicolor FP-101664 SS1]|uniref:uncharacterized protein n=1 Tax=Trametes versicolor (strain FP-101664) TaxID=717944 RepID=UPI00046238B4|nr:uncharacterized protein TRAVEDRAFT_166382 [Trametes versicolor FP-101664 SS1]EIW59136.1 hypothetical protein TRAVEDRAFT_166382 [Trametes versicolor FP-101664 SS1]